MRLALLGDLHLGRTLYRTVPGELNRFERIGYEVFNKNIDIILNSNIDYVIIAGDIFETANPSIVALNEFKKGMLRLKDVKILIVLGNHDFSFKNRTNDCSSVQSVIEGLNCNIVSFADYSLKYHIDDNYLFILVPYVYDNRNKINKFWDECKELCNKYKDKHKILITHGVTEYYANNFPGFENEYVKVPNELNNLFDDIFIGHIHKPFEYMLNRCRVVSPGSIINWMEPENDTGPLIFDDGTLYREHIDTPYSIKLTCNENNINETLKGIKEYIYKIKYIGDPSKIDNDLFTEAKNKALNLIIDIENIDTVILDDNNENKHLGAILDWVKEKYPDYYDDFTKI